MNVQAAIQAVTSALLALIAVIGAFLLVFYDVVNGKPVALPDFVSLLIGGVIGSYLTHAATVNGARQAGTAAAQTVVDKTVGGQGGTNVAGSPPRIP